jgi:hypothetical protein
MTTIIDHHPPSPTLSATSFISSASWNKKSPSELIPMLKNAYKALKEKERGNWFFTTLFIIYLITQYKQIIYFCYK